MALSDVASQILHFTRIVTNAESLLPGKPFRIDILLHPVTNVPFRYTFAASAQRGPGGETVLIPPTATVESPDYEPLALDFAGVPARKSK